MPDAAAWLCPPAAAGPVGASMNPFENLGLGRLLRIALVLVLGILAIYIEAAPLGLGPDAPPSPDLLLCIVVYWSIRQPDAIPIPVVFALGLMRDLLTDLPVGAGVLALVLISEGFKVWRRQLARSMFLTEWVALAAAALAGTALVWLLVVVTLAQPPYLTGLLHQCLFTAMIYPVLVVMMRWVLRIGWSRVENVA